MLSISRSLVESRTVDSGPLRLSPRRCVFLTLPPPAGVPHDGATIVLLSMRIRRYAFTEVSPQHLRVYKLKVFIRRMPSCIKKCQMHPAVLCLTSDFLD